MTKREVCNVGIGRRDFVMQSALGVASLCAPFSFATHALAAETRSVHIQPLGRALPQEDLVFVERALRAFFGFQISTLQRVELPKNAYYRPRRRYRAEKLLDFLTPRLPEGGFRILGLTAVDISTTKPPHQDWGILGLATIDGSACVLSSFRALRGAPNKVAARHRLGKVAVHEIGHTLGLPHCASVGCLMEDAQGKVSTTDREYDLCGECRSKLRTGGFDVNQTTEIPWPKP